MLKINMEFRKGVLFLRLIGDLNHHSYKYLKTETDNLINNVGIKYMIINLAEINSIDNFGLRLLARLYDDITNNQGTFIICGDNQKINKQKLVKIGYYNISELRALKMVNI